MTRNTNQTEAIFRNTDFSSPRFLLTRDKATEAEAPRPRPALAPSPRGQQQGPSRDAAAAAHNAESRVVADSQGSPRSVSLSGSFGVVVPRQQLLLA